jgi:hypothetical protein
LSSNGIVRICGRERRSSALPDEADNRGLPVPGAIKVGDADLGLRGWNRREKAARSLRIEQQG